VKQVEARYGKPEVVLQERGNFRALGYRYRGLMVIENYVAGISKSEFFDRADHRRLSDADVQQLLALSLTPGTTWKRLPDKGGNQLYVRSDGKSLRFLTCTTVCQCERRTSTSRNESENVIDCVKQRSRSHDAVIRVYNAAGNFVIALHGLFQTGL
jgi:hypothetical protein